MLDLDNATGYLLERGLIDADVIIDGELAIWSVPRRNRNLLVRGPGGSGYLIKQPCDAMGGDVELLGREAMFLDLCHREPSAAPMAPFVPRAVLHDPDLGVLVQGLIRDSVPLWSCFEAQGAGSFPVAVCRSLGEAIGTLHRVFTTPGLADDPRLGRLPRVEPWALSIHRPGPGLLAHLSPANHQAMRIIQGQDNLAGHLDGARRRWRPGAVIHGDVKSENVLARAPRPDPDHDPAPAAVWLVDWELVQVGDPAWDLAGALHDLILFWLESMPAAPAAEAERMAAEARYPLPVLQGGARALWRGYRSAAGVAPDLADDLLSRAVAFSAARLLQSTYEELYEREHLTARAVLSLQVAANILPDPDLTQAELYGIPQGPPGR